MTNKIILYVELPSVSISWTLKTIMIWTLKRTTRTWWSWNYIFFDINVNLASYIPYVGGHEEIVQFSIQRKSTLEAFVYFC